MRAWRAWRLPGRWPDGGRGSTVARWTRRRAAPAYALIPDLTFSRRSASLSWRRGASLSPRSLVALRRFVRFSCVRFKSPASISRRDLDFADVMTDEALPQGAANGARNDNPLPASLPVCSAATARIFFHICQPVPTGIYPKSDDECDLHASENGRIIVDEKQETAF